MVGSGLDFLFASFILGLVLEKLWAQTKRKPHKSLLSLAKRGSLARQKLLDNKHLTIVKHHRINWPQTLSAKAEWKSRYVPQPGSHKVHFSPFPANMVSEKAAWGAGVFLPSRR